MMSSKGSGTQGYRYLMSLLSGIARGPLNELVQIKIGDEDAWSGSADGTRLERIAAPELFGGEDKEGGVEGNFRVFMGARDQVLPSDGTGTFVNNPKASIGGLVSEFRGVVTLWFDGMVGAMNPYLKEWKFRARRSTAGWFNDNPWYPEKARILLSGDTLTVSTNKAEGLPVIDNGDATLTVRFTRGSLAGDEVTINGTKISFVDNSENNDLGDFEIAAGGSAESSASAMGDRINRLSTSFKATASVEGAEVTIALDQVQLSIHAMNAAHIIYECHTNPEWGRGLPADDMDENSFIYAANTLCNERFGLAIVWYRKEDIKVFVQRVCDLVGGVTYTDRETGKIVFRLVRDDYEIDTLPLFTPQTGLVSISDEDSASSTDSFNEIIGTSVDPVTNLKFQVRAQNLASFQSKKSVSSLDQDYKGIPTKSLLSRVVLRDLRAMGMGLKKYNLVLDRRGWRIAPGSVIRISHPDRNIANLVLRVAEIDDGNMVNGQIGIKATIDVFGLPATSYVSRAENGWVAPSKVAAPAKDQRLVEASYRDLYRRVGVANAETADPTSAYIGQLAIQPNGTSLEYDLAVHVDGTDGYEVRARGPFTGAAYFAAAVGPLDTVIPIMGLSMFADVNVGQALLVDAELMRLDALDVGAGTMTVTRGVGDSLPIAHAAGTAAWTTDDDLVSDTLSYARGELVETKVLTRTASQVLPLESASSRSLVLTSRHARPYPPANVTVNGASIYTVLPPSREPVVAWATRNRLTQGDLLVGYSEPSITPEANQKILIRVFVNGGPMLRETAVDGTTWTYTNAMRAADNAAYFGLTVATRGADGNFTADLPGPIVDNQEFRIALDADAVNADTLLTAKGVTWRITNGGGGSEPPERLKANTVLTLTVSANGGVFLLTNIAASINAVRITLGSQRDGLTSSQSNDFVVALSA